MKHEYKSFDIQDVISGDRDDVCHINEHKGYEKFSRILEKLKQYDVIKSYKEFADAINETSVGLNDIKTGRKNLSINHVKNINIKYPFINTDFILFNEGLPFNEDFLIAYHEDGKDYVSYYRFDLEAIENYTLDSENTLEIKTRRATQSITQDVDLLKELLSTKNELLGAKDKILQLQTEIYELKLKESK